MRKFRLRTPSPALVVSVAALVVALGGTSYAAFSLPNNSVGTKQLRSRAVTNAKLGPNSVGTAKINNNAVTASKINTSGLTVPTANAANSLNGVQVVRGGPFTNGPSSQNYGQANCPTGTNVIGGGVFGNGGTSQSVNSSWPTRTATTTPQPNAWGVYENNSSTTSTFSFLVYAVCAPSSVTSNYSGALDRK